MTALSVEDIIGGQPRFRTKDVDYGDGLKFKLHSFDEPTFREAMRELSEGEGDKEEYFYTLAMRAITGQHFEPTPEQIAGFRKNLDKGVPEALVRDWIAFNSGAQTLADAAKKS
jgi:hypothetical protein